MEVNKGKLFLAVLLLIANLCLAQKKDKITNRADTASKILKSGAIYIGDGSGLNSSVFIIKPEIDTIRVVMIVSDTSKLGSRYLFTMRGYVAISKWSVYDYLDEWKKPISKNYVVWQSSNRK
jgi:hypothetical protein